MTWIASCPAPVEQNGRTPTHTRLDVTVRYFVAHVGSQRKIGRRGAIVPLASNTAADTNRGGEYKARATGAVEDVKTNGRDVSWNACRDEVEGGARRRLVCRRWGPLCVTRPAPPFLRAGGHRGREGAPVRALECTTMASAARPVRGNHARPVAPLDAFDGMAGMEAEDPSRAHASHACN
eukprot:3124308-Pleurochrysis_carterae.AAC.2